ncbi:MAG: hypothetical protein ACI8X5_000342 [Planctomycetota bacterium]|jgi:hypothetical protein
MMLPSLPSRVSLLRVILFWAAALGLCACGDKPRPGVAPKHVLMISVENFRGDHITWLGYDRHTTGLLRLDRPSVLDLDFLGEGGVSFSRAFSPSSDDEFSVASLLSGSLPISGGGLMLYDVRPGSPSTLAEEFRDKGFLTGGFFNANSFSEVNASEGGFGRGFARSSFVETDGEVLADSVAWLMEGRDPDARYFTWLHLGGIRKPFVGRPFVDRFSAQNYAGPVKAVPAFFEKLEASEVGLNSEDRSRLVDLYDGQLLKTSELLNAFLFIYKTELSSGPLWGDTLIINVGTSGCELAENGGRVDVDDSLVDQGLNVPILMSHRRSMTGERILGSVVELVDVSATLRDWFSLEPEGEPQGRSLLNLADTYVEKEYRPYPALSFSSHAGKFNGYSLRSERWRLTEKGGEIKLFDLDVDPAGRRDVSRFYPQELARLQVELELRRAQLGLPAERP